jgi:hypothetical protein
MRSAICAHRAARPGRVLVVLSLVGALAAGWAPLALAGEGYGRTVFAFARLDPEPRGRALAGAHVAWVEGPSAAGWNPAGLAWAGGSQVAAAHASQPAGTSWDWAAASVGVTRAAGSIGVALGMVRAGSLPAYDADGTAAGDFRPLQLLAELSHGLRVGARGALGWGIAVLHEGDGLNPARTAVAFSLGCQWRAGGVALGLAGRNLGPALDGGGERRPLPATARAGASASPARWLRLHVAAEAGVAQPSRLLVGAAWRPAGPVEGLAGLRWDVEAAGEERLHPTLGLGIEAGFASVAYSYAPSELEAAHQIALEIPLSSAQ